MKNAIEPPPPGPTPVCLLLAAMLHLPGFSSGMAVDGYADELPIVLFPPGSRLDARADNLLQVRINADWKPRAPLSAAVSMRALAYAGRDFENTAETAALLGRDPGWLDLSWAQGYAGNSTVTYENIDRISAGFIAGTFTATIGRQRINWGTNLVWNPNDWFNAFNYLDFSYPEHPGTDAIRLKYYTGSTSAAELAIQAARTQSERTFAGLYKFNTLGYDWQIQAGRSGNDLAAGFSWSGSVMGGGFRGELSGYAPADELRANDVTAVASLSGDYTFSSSLYLHASFLYNGFGTTGASATVLSFASRVTAKSLLPKRWALFGEAAYQINPLTRIDCAASECPLDGSFFLTPTVAVSLLENLDIAVLGQYFFGEQGDLYGEVDHIGAVRLKWSF